MINLMKADFYRMKRTKSIYILVGILAACAILATIFSFQMEHTSISKKLIQQASGLADMMTMVVAGPFLAGMIICNDFQTKTIHDAILYANGRRTVVFGKLLTYSMLVMLLVLPYAICTLVGLFSGASFSSAYSHSIDSVFFSLLANETGTKIDGIVVLKLIAILITVMLIYAARMSVNIILVYTIRKPVVVVGLGIAIQLALSLIGPLSVSSELGEALIGWTPFASYGSVLNLSVGWGKITSTAGVCLAFMGMINAITAGIFQHSEIK